MNRDVSNNRLIGPIPESASALQQLLTFIASNNDFFGSVDRVGHLCSVTTLLVDRNPRLVYNGTWPSFAARNGTMHDGSSGLYRCSDVVGTGQLTSLQIDDTYFKYSHCACKDARATGAPACLVSSGGVGSGLSGGVVAVIVVACCVVAAGVAVGCMFWMRRRKKWKAALAGLWGSDDEHRDLKSSFVRDM